MTEQAKHSERFHETRRQFDELSLEDRAIFLLEATVSTLGRSLEQAGKTLGDALESAFQEAERRRAERESAGEGASPAEEGGDGAPSEAL
jgi:hypothetical protein